MTVSDSLGEISAVFSFAHDNIIVNSSSISLQNVALQNAGNMVHVEESKSGGGEIVSIH